MLTIYRGVWGLWRAAGQDPRELGQTNAGQLVIELKMKVKYFSKKSQTSKCFFHKYMTFFQTTCCLPSVCFLLPACCLPAACLSPHHRAPFLSSSGSGHPSRLQPSIYTDTCNLVCAVKTTKDTSYGNRKKCKIAKTSNRNFFLFL